MKMGAGKPKTIAPIILKKGNELVEAIYKRTEEVADDLEKYGNDLSDKLKERVDYGLKEVRFLLNERNNPKFYPDILYSLLEDKLLKENVPFLANEIFKRTVFEKEYEEDAKFFTEEHLDLYVANALNSVMKSLPEPETAKAATQRKDFYDIICDDVIMKLIPDNERFEDRNMRAESELLRAELYEERIRFRRQERRLMIKEGIIKPKMKIILSIESPIEEYNPQTGEWESRKPIAGNNEPEERSEIEIKKYQYLIKDCYERAISNGNTDSNTYLGLGYICYELATPPLSDKTIKYAERSIEAYGLCMQELDKPNYEDLYCEAALDQAKVYHMLRRFDEAADVLKKALPKAPTDKLKISMRSMMALAYDYSGKKDLAELEKKEIERLKGE